MDPALLATFENTVQFNPGYIAEPEDALSRGREFELTYNPTSYWTMKFNLTKIEAIQSSVAQDRLDYLLSGEFIAPRLHWHWWPPVASRA